MSQIKVSYIDHMGSDLSVVNAARVSFGKKSDWEWGEIDTDEYGDFIPNVLSDKDKKLIKYLAEHKHYSPFGHCFASFHVKAPIFVARQLVKHKFLRWNEISRRYVDDEPEFYMPEKWRGRPKNKKQGSEGVINLHPLTFIVDDLYYVEIDEATINVYNFLISQGVAPEQARMVLPQSTMTEWWWSGSLDAFANMYNLRSKPDAQYESRLVANQIGEKMLELFPISWKELTNDS